MTFELEQNYTIKDFCKKVLLLRFPGSPVKQEINDEDPDKLNFACPYCGDSNKDVNKKRGNLYLTTNNYKCYNDGCSILAPIEKFVAKWSKQYNLPLPTITKASANFTLATAPKKKGFLIEFLINKEVGSKLLKFNDLVSRFSLIPCTRAKAGSPIYEFITKRKIHHLPVFEKTCYYDSREDKIYLFNLDLRSDSVLGFAIRHIDDSWEGPKYNIKNYAEFKKTGLIKEIDDSFIVEVNTLNNYFNILNIDFSKEITVTEGQIDSMFVRNCIASTGVTKGKQLLENLTVKNKTRILFDNDTAGKRETISFLNKGYSVFLWSSALYELKKKYPSEYKKIKNIKDVNDLYRVILLLDSTLNFESFNDFLDKHFSKSPFDVILV